MASPMLTNLLPLCSSQKVTTRDGWAGASARLFLPFYLQSAGYWFASGQIATFPGATIPQDRSRTFSGITRPDSFQKECCPGS